MAVLDQQMPTVLNASQSFLKNNFTAKDHALKDIYCKECNAWNAISSVRVAMRLLISAQNVGEIAWTVQSALALMDSTKIASMINVKVPCLGIMISVFGSL
jgi:hypothetical protein